MLSRSDTRQLKRAIDVVREALDPELVGVYLFGSAVLGGLRPESDLDIFLLLNRPATSAEKLRVARGLISVSGKVSPQGTWRRVEVTAVAHRDVKPWRYPPILDLQYGDWLRDDIVNGRLDPWPASPRPDLALLITMVMAADTPLLGPPPAAVFEDPPRHDLRRAMLSDIDRLRGDLDWDTRNVLLTLARMWRTFACGDIQSKDAAAGWVLRYLPDRHRGVMSRARGAYLGHGTDNWDELKDAAASCADCVLSEIKRLAVAAGDLR